MKFTRGVLISLVVMVGVRAQPTIPPTSPPGTGVTYPTINGTPTPGQCATWLTTTKLGSTACAAGGGTWGTITGTLSAQTDLQNALNLKAPLASPTFTGLVTIPTPLTSDNSTAAASTAFVKAQGYLTANQTITISGDASGSGSTAITLTLANTAVTPGSYTCSNVTVDSKGRITTAANGSCGGGGTWGSITGTLSSQADLNTALGAKVAGASNLTNVGSIPWITSSGTLQQSTTLFWDSGNTRLGVGTGSPQQTLHVVGNTRIGTGGGYADLNIGTDTALGGYNGTQFITPVTIPGSGTSKQAIRFKNGVGGGTTQLDLIIDGQVAIGSTTAPTFNLDITGTLRATGNVTLGGQVTLTAFADCNNATTSKVLYSAASGFTCGTDQGAGGGMTNPMTTLGDTIYGAAAGAATRLAGNTTAVKQFLSQTGTGTVSAAPAWASLDAGDLQSGTIAAARMPAHTGDVTSSAGSVALTIAANAVTNAKAAQMPANSFKGNNTGATANAADLTVTQAKTLLNYVFSDIGGSVTDAQVPDNITITLAAAASALAANGANCGAGLLPRGVDAAGAAEGCAAVSLTTEVTGILPGANGGTGNGFFAVSGPATTLKTMTFPNANATILYDGGPLGTPSSATLTNATGLPIGGITGLGAGISTWWATPSSANLAAAITDESGSGAALFGTTPTITTPILTAYTVATLPAGSTGQIAVVTDAASAGSCTSGGGSAWSLCRFSGSAWAPLGDGGGGGSGITTLNTLTASSQSFATSTTGTDFTISSATSTHTFNLPDASATARGLITTGTQTIAGTKTFSGQTINSLNGAASTPPLTMTGTWFTGGTATTTKPQLLIEPTGSTSTGWSTSGTGLGVNAATGFAGNLMDLQLNGAARFAVASSGSITLGGPNITTAGAAAVWQHGGSMSLTIRCNTTASTAGTCLAFGFNGNRTATSGASVGASVQAGWAPTSGTGTYTQLEVAGTMNTTSTATGISRGLHLNQTMTSTYDHRFLELAATSVAVLSGSPDQQAVLFNAPTYTAATSKTITNAATVEISGAPIAGTNVGITNPYALWIQGGTTKFDGAVLINSASTISAQLNMLGGFRMRSGGSGSQPACNAGNQGMFWYTDGGGSANDTLQICARNNIGAYNWKDIPVV